MLRRIIVRIFFRCLVDKLVKARGAACRGEDSVVLNYIESALRLLGRDV